MKRSSLVLAVAFACVTICLRAQSRRTVSVDDLMTLGAIADVRISPDGERVAYVVAAAGGVPTRLGESVHIFNLPSPAPRVRWSPDGRRISVVAMVESRPQV